MISKIEMIEEEMQYLYDQEEFLYLVLMQEKA